MNIISHVDFIYVLRVVNIAATALVTDAATAIFGVAGVTAATGVMTVCLKFFLNSTKGPKFGDVIKNLFEAQRPKTLLCLRLN